MKVKALCPRCGAESDAYQARPGVGWSWWIRHRLEGCQLDEVAEEGRLIGPFPLPNQPSLVPVADLL